MAMNTRRRRAAWMGMLVLSILLTACTGTARLREASTLPSVARERMLGNWHIIANVPYFAERDKVATRVEYVQRSDGRVDDLYYFRRAPDAPEEHWSGVAWPLDDSAVRWKARFIWPFTTEFWIVGVDANYEVALVATPDAKLGWVYARTAEITPERYQAALAGLRAFGVDTTKMVRVPR